MAVPVIVIKGVVMNKVDEATKAAGFENVPANPTDIEASELYRSENFGQAIEMLQEKAGQNPELLKVGVLPSMVEFQIKDGERAKGYRYYAGNGEMGEFKVKMLKPTRSRTRSSRSRRSTTRPPRSSRRPSRLKDGSLRVTNMTLERGLVDGGLAWSVNAESDERTGIVFQADPDGSNLADPTKRALEENGLGGGSAEADDSAPADSAHPCPRPTMRCPRPSAWPRPRATCPRSRPACSSGQGSGPSTARGPVRPAGLRSGRRADGSARRSALPPRFAPAPASHGRAKSRCRPRSSGRRS